MTVSSLATPLLTPPPDVRPGVEHLVTEDDTPVDNLFSEKQQRLLTEPLYASWPGPGPIVPSWPSPTSGLFYAVEQPPFVPDMLLSLNVRCPDDSVAQVAPLLFHVGIRKASGRGDRDRLESPRRRGFRQVAGVRADSHPLLRDFRPRTDARRRDPAGLRMHRFRYRPLDDPGLLPGIGLGLQLWHGVYEDHDNTWLRWVDADGQLIATGGERAEKAQQQAEQGQAAGGTGPTASGTRRAAG